jgi:hypothetical protein
VSADRRGCKPCDRPDRGSGTQRLADELKHCCVADKRDFMYQATVDVASIRIWLRGPVT